jgi:hypothetical protein
VKQELATTGRTVSHYTLVLRRRWQTGLVARMGELKSETPSNSEVNNLGGLERVCKRYGNFVGRELYQRAGFIRHGSAQLLYEETDVERQMWRRRQRHAHSVTANVMLPVQSVKL